MEPRCDAANACDGRHSIMKRRGRGPAAVWLAILVWSVSIGIDGASRAEAGARQAAPAAGAQTVPAPAAPGQPQDDRLAPAGRGGRGGGGLPPMNPIDENAPPPPLVTPARVSGEPPSDAVVLFDG